MNSENKNSYNLSDLGNGKRLVAKYGNIIRYIFPAKQWFIYNGKRWKRDNSGYIFQLVKKTVQSIYHEAASIKNKENRMTVVKWALSSESVKHQRNMITSAQSESGIAVDLNEFDKNNMLLNLENGTMNLNTGKLQKHDAQSFITKITPIIYDSTATAPLWKSFLHTIFNGNSNLISFIQRAVGYSLTGLTTEQCLFLLYGNGSNGKSVFVNVIRTLLGDYAQQADFTTFIKLTGARVRNDIARMIGVRFVAAVESEDGRQLSEVVVKQLTGCDRITARFLFKEFFEFDATFKIWLVTNHLPEITGMDHAIWRRIKCIPFNVTITDDIRDDNLEKNLKAELPGILNWALKGCLEWQKNGLQTPDEVKLATEQYRQEMDLVKDFMSFRCHSDADQKVKMKDLYEEYLSWCKENLERPLTKRKFNRRIEDKGFQKVKSNGVRLWQGIGLLMN